jgi:hypothetical protein
MENSGRRCQKLQGKRNISGDPKRTGIFFSKRRTGKRSTRVTLSHETRMLGSHAKKIKDPRK